MTFFDNPHTGERLAYAMAVGHFLLAFACFTTGDYIASIVQMAGSIVWALVIAPMEATQ